MPRYLPEPRLPKDKLPHAGILLINLGTPEAPTVKAVRTYLREFLSDPRVIEVPRLVWWAILNLVILPFRSRRSAEKYACIWEKEGSPLRIHTEKQTKLLAGYLTESGHSDIPVVYAMRYGQPNIQTSILKLKEHGMTKLLVLPMYPQYAASSSASAIDAVAMAIQRIRNLPEIRFVRSFHDHPGYIQALTQHVRHHWQQEGPADKLIMSFHGLPRACIDKGDPYLEECRVTAQLLAGQLGLSENQYAICFQSRFGRTEWLRPDTTSTLRMLPGQGVKTVDVLCPGFVSDCLETLEEIAMEGKSTFLSAGGKNFRYIPALNETDAFIAALRGMALDAMQDWLHEGT